VNSDSPTLFVLPNRPCTRCHPTQFIPIDPQRHRSFDSSRVSLPATHPAPISWRPRARLLKLSLVHVHVVVSWNRFDMVAGGDQIAGFDKDTEQRDILKLSHGTAIVLLFSEFHPSARPLLWSGPLTIFFTPKFTFRTSSSNSFLTRACTMTKLVRNLRQSSTPLALGRARRRRRRNSLGSPQ